MADHYDVIIVGSGAGGGTLAHRLAPSGKKILILERGDWLPREARNWNVEDVFHANRYVSPDTWFLPNGAAFQPQVHYFVGGATKVFGAALFRLRREDFGEMRHYDGVSPAWPLGYDEVEPYYSEAEQLYQVHGEHGVDPTEPPSSRPYPAPLVSHEPRIAKLFDDLTAAGYHPFPAPSAVMMNERDMAYSRCIRCQTCDGFPCLMHAKSDAEMIAVRPALERSNVTLLRNARVEKLETNAAGAYITGVVAEVGGARQIFSADIVVVSCGAVNSAALLLRSANDRHPNGLANGSDQVGRNYMFHNSQAVLALSLTPNDTMFQKTLALNDFYFGMDGFPFPMGNIQMIGKTLSGMYRAEKPLLTALMPDRALEEIARHAVDFLVDHRGSSAAGQSGDRRSRWPHYAGLPAEQPGPDAQALRQIAQHAWPDRIAVAASGDAQPLYAHRYRARGLRASSWDLSLRRRSRLFGARPELQGA